MKVVKYCVATSLVLLILGGLMWAQEDVDRPRRQRRPDGGGRMRGQGGARGNMGNMLMMRLSRVFRALQTVELTDEQKQTVEALRVEFTEKIEPLTKALGEKSMAMRERRQNDPDDAEGLETMRREMRETFELIGKSEAELIEKIKAVLTEEQVKKFDEALTQGRGGGRMGRAMRQLLPFNPRVLGQLELTEEQRQKLQALLTEYQEAFGKLRTEYEEKFKELLTDEQKQKVEAANETAPGGRRGFRRGDREGRGDQEGRRRRRRPGRDENPEPDDAN